MFLRRRFFRRAHPRVCGENFYHKHVKTLVDGSSPRVRGKHELTARTLTLTRLIPACAGKTKSERRSPPTLRAHPRVCGENQEFGILQVARLGSSPRVRGKRDDDTRRGPVQRLIPACAGKTSWPKGRCATRAAHPRVCGENAGDPGHARVLGGSSPRVRGKPRRRPRKRVPPGLIPACAGKTPAGPRKRPRRPAHPRVCGENAMSVSSKPAIPGSSPRVRGKPCGRAPGAARAGLIPACAGKTSSMVMIPVCRAAHPRVCGENVLTLFDGTAVPGSSPRVRGKPVQHRRAPQGRRLIPACAGKTGSTPIPSSPTAAHPRVCGENVGGRGGVHLAHGSSPRVRGKLTRIGDHHDRHRLIPARAGKTNAPPQRTSSPRAHPRACGENWSAPPRPSTSPGSSPRVRGKLYEPGEHELGVRLIPARAGKTVDLQGATPAHPGSSPRVRGKPSCCA